MQQKTGLVHVYTGDGKGKTTAAVGLATRAVGQGMKVCYASFHKNPEIYGYSEMTSLKKLGVKVLNYAKGHPHLDKSLDVDVISEETRNGLKSIIDLVANHDFDMLILDEILISVRDGFLSEKELIKFIQKKPVEMELILTGRGATSAIIDLSHYVTRLDKVKHPYDIGFASRKGIEY